MIKLCGFAASNYYNKVKLVLIEKKIDFEEELIWPDRSVELLRRSPLGKIPYIETEQGSLCESQVILEYLEDQYPDFPLLPENPYSVAKIRELITFLELHLELVARELYSEAFFGGSVSAEAKSRVEKVLARNIKVLGNMLKFSPYVAGSEFSIADCVAVVHFPLISMATKAIYGRDFLEDLPVREYLKMMAGRPSMQRVNAERKANQTMMADRMKTS